MIVKELLEPRSIVVVGGSDDIEKPGGRILKNLIDGNFKGKLSVVNPKNDIIQGIPCQHDVSEIDQTDLAIIAISAKFANETVKTLIRDKGTKAFIIISAGFGELGPEGKAQEKELVRIMNEAGASMIGPNCMGVLTPTYHGTFGGPIPKLDKKGVDFVSGSGSTCCFILETAIPRGMTFSSSLSVGNSAQIGVEEILEYWDESFDPETSSRVKMLYLENVHKPEMLLRHASSLISKGCRIVALKSGTTEAGSRAASSHTGALAGSDTSVDALFRKAGIVRVYSREELVNTASVLFYKELMGNRLAVITHAGGPGVMITDALTKHGMAVPNISGPAADELLTKLFFGSSVSNPIDFLATGTPEHLGTILDYVDEKFDDIDGSVVIFGTPGLFDVTPAYDMLHEKMNTCRKPIFPVLPSIVVAKDAVEHFQGLGRISFPDEVSLAEALANVYNTSKPCLNVEMPAVDAAAIRKVIDGSENGYLAPEKVQALLDAAGIERAKEFTAATEAEARKFAGEVGFPLVMKVVGPLHKTDVGGVKLNIKTEEEVAATYEHMMKIDGAVGVLLQPMLRGTEVFVGAKKEPEYGHLILCGLGGIFIEALKDVASGLCPISTDTALRMIRSLRSYKIIQGVRGQEGVNEQKFAEVINRLSALLSAAPEIAEMDINPLLGRADGLTAVDARIRIEK